MIADSERREVARRLRELDYADLQESLICAYLDALGIEGYADWFGIARRLADLIEPSCDREALLELADELDENAGLIIRAARNAQFTGCGPTMEEAKHDACEWRQIARRIREALGVSE